MERDRRSRGMWELVSEAIARINSRLDELERRIDELSSCRPVFDESRVVEGEGLLGGRMYLASENRDVQKIIRIPACDVCGSALARLQGDLPPLREEALRAMLHFIRGQDPLH